jgi:hypothetical protein
MTVLACPRPRMNGRHTTSARSMHLSQTVGEYGDEFPLDGEQHGE